jgi:hypothetical protein
MATRLMQFTRRRQRSTQQVADGLRLLPPYAIGSVAMFWVIQRVAAF